MHSESQIKKRFLVYSQSESQINKHFPWSENPQTGRSEMLGPMNSCPSNNQESAKRK